LDTSDEANVEDEHLRIREEGRMRQKNTADPKRLLLGVSLIKKLMAWIPVALYLV
jgi:hypothetical protein